MPENIYSLSHQSSLTNENIFISNIQPNKNNFYPTVNTSEKITNIFPTTLTTLTKQQSHNIILTVVLIAILIILKDIIANTIENKNFKHKHALTNLILFIVIYTILF
jgi:hypothetical protein